MSREYMTKQFRKILYKRAYIFLVHLLRTSGDKRTIEMWRILNSLIFNLTKNVLAWCGHGHYETLTSGTGLIRCLSCTLNENQESFGVLGLLHLLADFQIENSVEQNPGITSCIQLKYVNKHIRSYLVPNSVLLAVTDTCREAKWMAEIALNQSCLTFAILECSFASTKKNEAVLCTV